MNIYVDASVFTANEAIGRTSGLLPFSAVPSLGSVVMLSVPPDNMLTVAVDGFTGRLKVEDLRFQPGVDGEIALSLEDITVQSREDALIVLEFLKAGFGLDYEVYGLD